MSNKVKMTLIEGSLIFITALVATADVSPILRFALVSVCGLVVFAVSYADGALELSK